MYLYIANLYFIIFSKKCTARVVKCEKINPLDRLINKSLLNESAEQLFGIDYNFLNIDFFEQKETFLTLFFHLHVLIFPWK